MQKRKPLKYKKQASLVFHLASFLEYIKLITELLTLTTLNDIKDLVFLKPSFYLFLQNLYLRGIQAVTFDYCLNHSKFQFFKNLHLYLFL